MDDKKFKFDVVIGNPPYQEEAPGESTSDKPIYHLFMNESFKVGEKVELITPARFLFNAGATPKKWNEKMLSDKHLRVLYYNDDATKVFNNTSITGGVAVTYYDSNIENEAIGIFVPYENLRRIREKVINRSDFEKLSSIVSGRTPYLFTNEMHTDNPDAKVKLSKGHSKDISSNAFTVLSDIFMENSGTDDEYCRVLGRLNNKRTYLWIKKRYVVGREDGFIGKWKVFLPKANGASGMLGEKPARLISKPEIGNPYDIATDTFLVVGAFDTEYEAEATLKYLKSKFTRVLLGILKVTQINSKETWSNVPIQDFTENSDIDWSKSIPEIDQQLYKKYGLDKDEINFIETKVKEMN